VQKDFGKKTGLLTGKSVTEMAVEKANIEV